MNQDIRESREKYIALVERLIAAARGSQSANDMLDDAVSNLFGSNRTDARCADFLQRFGSMSAGELATRSGLSTGAVTSVIDRLEEAGIARRVRDKKDRRKVFVELTDYTNQVLAEIFSPMGHAFGGAMKDVSMSELRAISEYLEFTERVSLRYANGLNSYAPNENSSNEQRLTQVKIFAVYIKEKNAELIETYGREPTEPPQSGKKIE